MDRTKIKNILDKNEMSIYDCGTLFREIGSAIEDFKGAIVYNAQYAVEDAETLINNAKKMLVDIDSWHQKLSDMVDGFVQKSEAIMSKAYEANRNARDGMKKLSDFGFGEFKVPYNVEKFLEIAYRCRDLDDIAWARLIDLAKALNK
jgi:hypothetical protein